MHQAVVKGTRKERDEAHHRRKERCCEGCGRGKVLVGDTKHFILFIKKITFPVYVLGEGRAGKYLIEWVIS
jgi:hypothetical protein